jgi:glycosyltransferase involved in cell wall biosynthesis
MSDKLAEPRVMHILPSLENGGVQKATLDLVTDMPDIDMAIVGINAGGEYQEYFEKHCPTFVMAHEDGDLYRRYGWFKPGPVLRLANVIKDFEPNIVQTHTFGAASLGRAAAKLTGVPVIVDTLHSVYTWKDRSALRIDGILGKWTDRIVCVSSTVQEYAIQQNPRIPANKYEVIPNGVDVGRYHPRSNREDTLARFGVSSEKLVIGSVSRLVQMKRTRDLVAAAPKILRKYPNTHFLIVGDGPAAIGLTNRVEELDLQESFTFTGTVADTENIYPALDVFAQTSEREGFGLSLAEAMACGTAVIASNTGAVPELVRPGHNGLLYEVGDVEALTKGICSLLADPKKRERFGVQANHDIESNFNLSAVPDKYRELWNRLLSSKR